MSTTAPLIAPSILASDWGRIDEEVKAICAAGADLLHVDVMDGQFVPPITFGPQMVAALKKSSSVPLDVHLMIAQPERQIDAFAEAGADFITIHHEASPHLHRGVQQIKEHGIKAGVALNPGTPVSVLEPIIAQIDLVLIMTVNPGWGGQAFIEESPVRIGEAAALIKKSGRAIHLEVDGGISETTAPQAVKAGADVLVAGTFVFGGKDYAESIASLKQAGG